MQYHDRAEAGKWLALELKKYAGLPEVVVIALEGGGVPVANEVARSLKAPADILVVRKLRVPEQPSVVFGAITSGEVQVLDDVVVQRLEVTPADIEKAVGQEKAELQRKEFKFRDSRPFPLLKGKTVVVVDDGITTGASMKVAVAAIKQQQPAKVVVAVPVAPARAVEELKHVADEVVCLLAPHEFGQIHDYYYEFHSVSEDEIHKLLEWAAERVASA